jgi:hypothetical protein
MNTFELTCAAIASAIYIEGRNKENQVKQPYGAIPLDYISDLSTGFEAGLYEYNGQYIIAYAGTDPSDWNDGVADGLLGFGVLHPQAKQAAEFYERAKQRFGVSNVTFTGHSLGGGLASLMGVFFNLELSKQIKLN